MTEVQVYFFRHLCMCLISGTSEEGSAALLATEQIQAIHLAYL